MTLFFFITLCVSATGLILLLSVKRYEMSTGHVIFVRARPSIARALHTAVLFVQYILPFVARRSLAHAVKLLRAALSNLLARLTVFIEGSLHRLLEEIHHLMQPKRGGGAASAFLQEVADHKRKLLKDPAEKRAIFEEFK